MIDMGVPRIQQSTQFQITHFIKYDLLHIELILILNFI